jgi:hypothetical protein
MLDPARRRYRRANVAVAKQVDAALEHNRRGHFRLIRDSINPSLMLTSLADYILKCAA